ncbi:hypothetical protein [Jannaschia rubra]|uniref:hypothetical protein n=1 Tax=Jannaschia rubra TaxID=282197 RepID=UPI002490D31C|nr:hypothetical protein [Jannaschia rubra]
MTIFVGCVLGALSAAPFGLAAVALPAAMLIGILAFSRRYGRTGAVTPLPSRKGYVPRPLPDGVVVAK